MVTLFEWCLVRCGSKNGHQKDMCSKEIRLYAQILLTVLDLIVNIIFFGGAYVTELRVPGRHLWKFISFQAWPQISISLHLNLASPSTFVDWPKFRGCKLDSYFIANKKN